MPRIRSRLLRQPNQRRGRSRRLRSVLWREWAAWWSRARPTSSGLTAASTFPSLTALPLRSCLPRSAGAERVASRCGTTCSPRRARRASRTRRGATRSLLPVARISETMSRSRQAKASRLASLKPGRRLQSLLNGKVPAATVVAAGTAMTARNCGRVTRQHLVRAQPLR